MKKKPKVIKEPDPWRKFKGRLNKLNPLDEIEPAAIRQLYRSYRAIDIQSMIGCTEGELRVFMRKHNIRKETDK